MRRLLAGSASICLLACSGRVAVPEEEITEADAAHLLALADCEPQLECDCDDIDYANTEYVSVDECVQDREAFYAGNAERARAADLVFDPECVATIVARMDEIGCDPRSSFAFPEPQLLTCHVYVPADEPPTGSPCTTIENVSASVGTPCMSGEVCAEGRCSGLWPFSGGDLGAPCTEVTDCRHPYSCVEDACTEPLPVGATCREVFIPCDDLGYCDGETCVAKLAPGEPCTNDGFNSACATRECGEGVCVDAPLVCGYSD
jgi:hypothetical protein